MSRKTNNLRRRIRMNDEQMAAHLRQAKSLQKQLQSLRDELAQERLNPFTRSVMISVEKQSDRFEQYGVTVQFSPDAYVWHAKWNAREPQNLDYMAFEIGRKIGAVVTETIREKLRRDISRP
jgi:hypothetical protein